MATWDDVRELGLALPETQESTSYRLPALEVAGKTFANMSPHEDGALVVRADPDERPLLIGAQPNVYFVTPHYENHPLLLVRLEAVLRADLRGLLEDSWLIAAPKRLVAKLDTD